MASIMTQPTPYARQTSFSDFSALFPSLPHSGPMMDAEMNAVSATLAGVLTSLALIQRDDGKVANASVNLEQLGTGVIALLTSAAGWRPRGAWVTGLAYIAGDFIAQGTGTYVCAVAHTAGSFLLDKAAGKWILLFDTAGVTPADGSVTEIKLAAGSVTTPAIGFAALDLPGTVRAAGGLAAGSAPLGALMHARLATGAVYGTVERVTDAQGAAGYQIIGVTATWAIEQAVNSSALQFRRNAIVGVTFTTAGGIDAVGAVRVLDGTGPTTGNGAHVGFATNVGSITSFDYDAVLWRDFRVAGKDVYIRAGGIDVVKVTATGVDMIGTVTKGGVALGYIGIPANPQAGAYTISATDAGEDIYSENVGGQNITIPTNAALALATGFSVSITNDGTGPITIITTGVVVRLAGTTTIAGNRTIAAGGQALLRKVKGPDRWWIGGAGVS